MTECEFPLFRQRFWGAAQWTDDTGDDQIIRQQQLQQQQQQRSQSLSQQQNKHNTINLIDLHARSYEVKEHNLYAIDENLDWVRSNLRRTDSTSYSDSGKSQPW